MVEFNTYASEMVIILIFLFLFFSPVLFLGFYGFYAFFVFMGYLVFHTILERKYSGKALITVKVSKK